jgi:hypothetical protein
MSQLPPFNVSPDVENFFLSIYSKEHWEKLCKSVSSPPSKTFFRVILPLDYEPHLNFKLAVHKRRGEILHDFQNAINKVNLLGNIKLMYMYLILNFLPSSTVSTGDGISINFNSNVTLCWRMFYFYQ